MPRPVLPHLGRLPGGPKHKAGLAVVLVLPSAELEPAEVVDAVDLWIVGVLGQIVPYSAAEVIVVVAVAVAEVEAEPPSVESVAIGELAVEGQLGERSIVTVFGHSTSEAGRLEAGRRLHFAEVEAGLGPGIASADEVAVELADSLFAVVYSRIEEAAAEVDRRPSFDMVGEHLVVAVA